MSSFSGNTCTLPKTPAADMLCITAFLEIAIFMEVRRFNVFFHILVDALMKAI